MGGGGGYNDLEVLFEFTHHTVIIKEVAQCHTLNLYYMPKVRFPRASKFRLLASENGSFVVWWASEICLSSLGGDNFQLKTISKLKLQNELKGTEPRAARRYMSGNGSQGKRTQLNSCAVTTGTASVKVLL